jgi:hypothetical protein
MRDLHEQLRSLVSQHGTGIADNAEQFRAALDDYLTEDDATQGELNLLVDAVRLGGVERLVTMLENGADPDAAVREAGGELARDRSSDEQRARWAVAAMGYALGRVGAVVVRQQLEGDATRLPYGATSPAAPKPPVQSPPVQSPQFQSPVQSPPFQSPPPQSPGPDTAGPPAWPTRHSSGQPPVRSGPGYPSQASPLSAYGSAGTQSRKSRTGLVIGLVVVGVAVVAGAIVLALVLGDDDGDNGGNTASDDQSEQVTGCQGEGCIEGDGYTYELPDAWQDITDQVLKDNPGQPTLDTASAWGKSVEEGRANVIVEVSSWIYTDLGDAEDVLTSNLETLGGTVEDIEDRTIDGEPAAGVLLSRANEQGVDVEQTAYIIRVGDDAVVITASNKAGDDKPQDAYEEIYDSWSWE